MIAGGQELAEPRASLSVQGAEGGIYQEPQRQGAPSLRHRVVVLRCTNVDVKSCWGVDKGRARNEDSLAQQ